MVIDPFAPPANPDLDNLPTAADRVAAAIVLLGSYRAGKANALSLINVDRLDFKSVRLDVLGQIYGSNSAGLNQLGLTVEQAVWLGLDVIDDDHDGLVDAWATALDTHRSQPLPRRCEREAA